MAKRSVDERSSKRVVKVEDKKSPEPSKVKLILLKDIILNYRGKVSGELYRFPGAGSVVNVDERDVEIMLQKKSGQCGGCPSSIGASPYFQVIE